MKAATEILLAAAFVLTPKRQWTQRVYARRADGTGTNGYDDAATCWCMTGALEVAHWTLRTKGDLVAPQNFQKAFRTLEAVCGARIERFNDAPKRKHREVLAALYKAAEISEAS